MGKLVTVGLLTVAVAGGQMIDNTQALNPINAGINKSLMQEIGAGRGDINTAGSSLYIIKRDPFRSVRRGRQLFQRKFTRTPGQGPGVQDGVGNIASNIAIGAGVVDSCAGCHARPRGSAGFGGDVVTRPDSRNTPHLFGLGLKEMLADEMTSELRAIRSQAVNSAKQSGKPVTLALVTKGVSFGSIMAHPDGSVNTSQVQGVDPGLRIRPFFAHGGTISKREFIVGALNAERGLQALDPDLATASAGGRVVTPSGMILDGSSDKVEAPPGPDQITNAYEIDVALVDHLEFYFQVASKLPITLYGHTGLVARGLVGLQWLTRGRGLGASNHFEAGGFIRSHAGVRYPDIQFHFLPLAVSYDWSSLAHEHGFQAHVGPMRSRSAGWVRLRSATATDKPLIFFNYMSHPEDWQEMRACVRLTREIFAQPAFARYRAREIQPGEQVQTDEQIDAFIRAKVESAFHPSCSCKMGGISDPMAVVDKETRVIGIEALRVVDSSIMPSITTGNLNAPTIMVAEKAADHIRGKPLLPRASAPYYIAPQRQSRQR